MHVVRQVIEQERPAHRGPLGGDEMVVVEDQGQPCGMVATWLISPVRTSSVGGASGGLKVRQRIVPCGSNAACNAATR